MKKLFLTTALCVISASAAQAQSMFDGSMQIAVGGVDLEFDQYNLNGGFVVHSSDQFIVQLDAGVSTGNTDEYNLGVHLGYRLSDQTTLALYANYNRWDGVDYNMVGLEAQHQAGDVELNGFIGYETGFGSEYIYSKFDATWSLGGASGSSGLDLTAGFATYTSVGSSTDPMVFAELDYDFGNNLSGQVGVGYADNDPYLRLGLTYDFGNGRTFQARDYENLFMTW
ncbi:hypothetical protein [Aliiroseovarius subalbicans]|uniref:hypothetical protein n=1 Tax=Aliiroseovarius subalbicans TaxID=2925840 RepID=UPI001F59A82E|nr:hypothetical protein [Aliiroseovarius subalbicans]MCI2398435.1 hypothetical protein [Aliiroseovarius subalbicans]